MARPSQDTSAEEPDGGNLHVRLRGGPGRGNQPGLLNSRNESAKTEFIAVRRARTDAETAKSVDRLGRMLKRLHPKDKDWASPSDRKRWWALVTELESTAKSLRR
jgi:hypothetical protein